MTTTAAETACRALNDVLDKGQGLLTIAFSTSHNTEDRMRSRRLQRYLDLGLLDEEDATETDAALLQELETEDAADDSEAPLRPVGPTQSVTNADCLKHMRGMAARSVDCVVTSPPYNLGKKYSLHNDRMPDAAYLDWQGEVAAEIARLLKPAGHLFLNVGSNSEHPERSVEVFLRYRTHLRLQNRITWVKSLAVDATSLPSPLRHAMHERTIGHFTSLSSTKYLSPTTEDIWHLTPAGDSPIDPRAEQVGVPYVWADQPERFGHHRERHCRGAAWHIPYRTTQSAADRDDHQATFPVTLPLMCLRLAALPPGAVVLDPFSGTGSTLLAARTLGLDAIGIEIDPAYCAATRRRLDDSVILL